jgi:hypothetical protein
MRRILLCVALSGCAVGNPEDTADDALVPDAAASLEADGGALADAGDEKHAECQYSHYNCRLQSGSGGGHRARDPVTGNERWPVARGTALRDGSGNVRGTVSDAAVMVNWGQRKRIDGANHVYVWNATLANGSSASGWIRESALRDGPVHMPTLALPNPGQGDYPTARLVTGGDPAAYGDLTHTPNYDGDGSKAAHYLLRPGNVVNLFYNVGQMGGIAADTFPTGVTFRRAMGVGQIEIPLYRPGDDHVARRMPFIYGHIGSRYGWMAVDAMALVDAGAPPEAPPPAEVPPPDAPPGDAPPPDAPPPPAQTHSCFARCCDGTLAGPMDTPDANTCHAASGPACEAHGHVRRAEWDGRTAYERDRVCWAKCRNRDAYHEVEGVTQDCTAHARDYCAAGSRGGLQDAAWDACQP